MNKVYSLKLAIGLLLLLSACAETKDDVQPKNPAASVLPSLQISEFLASNKSNIRDEIGESDDWIEIHNYGTEAVDIGGLYFSDNKDKKSKYRIPATESNKTILKPGAYLILWADGSPEQGILHLNFSLSAEGEDIGIYTQDEKIIDETTFGTQVTDVSTGRLPSNPSKWASFAVPTPGAPNQQDSN